MPRLLGRRKNTGDEVRDLWGRFRRYLNDLRNVLDQRQKEEVAAARRAADHPSSADIDQLRAGLAAFPVIREETNVDEALLLTFRNADRDFHTAVVRATGDSELEQRISDSRELYRAYLPGVAPPDLANQKSQHEAILRAIEEGSPDDAARAMELHMRHTQIGLCKTVIDPLIPVRLSISLDDYLALARMLISSPEAFSMKELIGRIVEITSPVRVVTVEELGL